jgi:O-antigen/teichoic acid export membrane protein
VSSDTIKNIFQTVVVRFGAKAANFIFFIVLARKLDDSEIGLYGLIFTTSLILSVLFDIGLRNSSAKFIAQTKSNLSRVLLSLHLLWFGVSILGFITIYVLPNFFDSLLAINDYKLQFCVLFASMLYVRIFQGSLLGMNYIKDYNKSEAFSRSILIVIITILIFFDNVTLNYAVWCLTISQVSSALYIWVYFIKSGFFEYIIDIKIIKNLLYRGFLFMIAVILMNLSQKLPFYMLTEYTTLQSSGSFFKVVRLSEILVEIALAISVVMFSESVAKNENINFLDKLASTSRHSVLIIFVLSIIMIVFGKPILWAAFQDYDIELLNTFRVVVLASFCSTFWTIIFPSLAVRDNPIIIAILFVPCILVYFLLFFLSVKFYLTEFNYQISSYILLAGNIVTSSMFLLYLKFRHKREIFKFLIFNSRDYKEIKVKIKNKI